MNGRFVLRGLISLILLVGIIAGGYFIYQMGVAQGVAQGAPAGNAPAQGYYYPYPGPFFPFWGLGCFGLLIPLFFVLVLMSILRGMWWRGHMGRGLWREKFGERGVPGMFEEWHNRAHEQKSEPAGEPKPEGKSAKA